MKKIIREYLIENIDLAKQVVTEVNAWDGSLEWLDYHYNDEEFFNVYFEDRPMEVARAVQYGDYNYCDEYVHFNGLGNLESCNEWEYQNEIMSYMDEIIERMIEVQNKIYLPLELETFLNELEEEEE